MPLRLKDIKEYDAPISFEEKGGVTVRVGPCSGQPWSEEKIPLDGRHYICAGTVILKNGLQLQANFEISTHTFDFLDRDSVKVYIDNEKAWYYMDELELYEILGLTMDEALPYKWLTDRPLDYFKNGPYPMKWHTDEKWTKRPHNRSVYAIGLHAAKTSWLKRKICNGGMCWPADAGSPALVSRFLRTPKTL